MISVVDLCLCFDDLICFRQSAHFRDLFLYFSDVFIAIVVDAS